MRHKGYSVVRSCVQAVAVLVASLWLALATQSTASAQTSKAAADALFEAAKSAMEQGDYAAACPKFAESQRLDPAPGTLMNLADCYEKLGRTASAWATWREAEERARSAGQTDREQHALSRWKALESRVVHVVVAVPPASRCAGLGVSLDGAPVAEAMWAVPVPLDPGAHTVEAAAPGRVPWRQQVEVRDGMEDVTVEVPPLAVESTTPGAVPPGGAVPGAAPGASPATPAGPAVPPYTPNPPPQARPARPRGAGMRTAGFVVGGAGVVGLGIGAIFGGQAMAKNDDSQLYCRTETLCTPQGKSLRDDAFKAATASTVGFAVGGVALATGIVLIVASPRPAPAVGVRATPQGVWLEGRF